MKTTTDIKSKDELAKQARNEYYKKYRQENKEKIREYNTNYWARKALERKEK